MISLGFHQDPIKHWLHSSDKPAGLELVVNLNPGPVKDQHSTARDGHCHLGYLEKWFRAQAMSKAVKEHATPQDRMVSTKAVKKPHFFVWHAVWTLVGGTLQLKPSSSLKTNSKRLFCWIAQPLQEETLCFTTQLNGSWHLVIYHSIHAFLVAVSYETQVEAQPCRWKRLSNSILSKPASSQRRGRHVGLILILLTLHQRITTDFECIIVALLQHQEDEK